MRDDPDRKYAKADCPTCHGAGWEYANPRLASDGKVACDCVVKARRSRRSQDD